MLVQIVYFNKELVPIFWSYFYFLKAKFDKSGHGLQVGSGKGRLKGRVDSGSDNAISPSALQGLGKPFPEKFLKNFLAKITYYPGHRVVSGLPTS